MYEDDHLEMAFEDSVSGGLDLADDEMLDVHDDPEDDDL